MKRQVNLVSGSVKVDSKNRYSLILPGKSEMFSQRRMGGWARDVLPNLKTAILAAPRLRKRPPGSDAAGVDAAGMREWRLFAIFLIWQPDARFR